jgi:hypothetical protein
MSRKCAPLEQRFWTKVAVKTDDVCWEWTGALTRSGYGWVHTSAGARAAQRVAALLAGLLGSLDNPLHVLHKCDNPKCCNPKHLFLGTNLDNVADRVSKGRSGSRPLHGQANGASKLTDMQVRQIRGMYKFAKFSQSQLAKIFAVNQPHISRIVSGARCGGVL